MMLRGTVERRLLVNYRVDPDVVRPLVPAPFRPAVVNGSAVAGICLIRLGGLRPAAFPARLGWRPTENAAHRIAVEWDGGAGVYIPRRDSDSLVTRLVGGRLFPGVHHAARFHVVEDDRSLHISFASTDGSTSVSVDVDDTTEFESGVFADLEAASSFFQAGSVGYSPGPDADCLDGIELRTDSWRVSPVRAVRAASSFFDDTSLFPPGSAVLDCALLMRDVPVTWHAVTGANDERRNLVSA